MVEMEYFLWYGVPVRRGLCSAQTTGLTTGCDQKFLRYYVSQSRELTARNTTHFPSKREVLLKLQALYCSCRVFLEFCSELQQVLNIFCSSLVIAETERQFLLLVKQIGNLGKCPRQGSYIIHLCRKFKTIEIFWCES